VAPAVEGCRAQGRVAVRLAFRRGLSSGQLIAASDGPKQSTVLWSRPSCAISLIAAPPLGPGPAGGSAGVSGPVAGPGRPEAIESGRGNTRAARDVPVVGDSAFTI
jgi:hypothetical protein